jgi:hypothetical protein
MPKSIKRITDFQELTIVGHKKKQRIRQASTHKHNSRIIVEKRDLPECFSQHATSPSHPPVRMPMAGQYLAPA